MKTRAEISQETYEQALKLAQHLPNDLAAELKEEAQARFEFEQQAVEKSQKFTKKRPLVIAAILVLALVAAVAVGIYAQSGRFQIVQKGEQLHQAFEVQSALESKEQKNSHYILSLQDRLRANPNDGDLWYELGQAYALNNDFNAAIICFDNAQKVLGKKAAILGAMATADYYENGQNLSENAKAWLAESLKLDAKESASLLLLATDAYRNKDYAGAVSYWRRVLDSDNEALDRRAVIQSIAEAQAKLKVQQ